MHILGETTFGKGSVQSILPFDDGSALRLTTAKYYTPSHKVIHEKGITPDIVVPTTEEQESAILVKRAPGGLEVQDLACHVVGCPLGGLLVVRLDDDSHFLPFLSQLE